MPTTIPVNMSNSPPAYLFVVRHGSRLDAADKSWHLTSPTPYDPPLTYGGFLQARQVGNQIASILEQAKADDDSFTSSSSSKKRRRFKIVIHSSPFLRCVQTSIGISSGLAQTFPDSVYNPADLIVPRGAPQVDPQFQFKSTLLRLDSFLGEWLSPEYFEMITPPPGPALMLGGAKAELLRREDYSIYADIPEPEPPRPSSGSLWQSPTASPANLPQSPSTDSEESINVSTLGPALPVRRDFKKGYTPPRPIYAVSSSGAIPDGFVAHARDASVAVDYQWDSMRAPLDFGDGGKFGEEWASMHRRFRGGVRRLVNWYASTDSPAEAIAKPAKADGSKQESDDDDVETVVVMVSHGAGCNALIGAITHQPVLMDIGIASITMASRKENLDYTELLSSTPVPADPSKKTMVPVDKMYDIRLSASTDHLRRPSTTTTPNSARSTSTTNILSTSTGLRGRTSTLGGPVMSPFTYSDPFSLAGSRSTSASAALPPVVRRESAPHRPSLPRGPALASVGFSNGASSSNTSNGTPPALPSTSGMWSAGPSSLRLMDDGSDDTDDFGSLLPDFDQKRFKIGSPVREKNEPDVSIDPIASTATDDAPTFPEFPTSMATDVKDSVSAPAFANRIKLQTNLVPTKPVEEMKVMQLGAGLGGLWGIPPPLDEAERFRDKSHLKRRWTVNERA
ncbi:hypothetical protein QQS21_012109 [Conoideocrella luteorostrata]|uniref:Phosphoglycerate mutase n=1 Tax=Conoideocrella luteorostrata TaxID=1105319 RepID=A0AAJ0CC22_9HYPO|nr:hypothetical protein QQS21_012109 [Conoideocrella luteorostrata]